MRARTRTHPPVAGAPARPVLRRHVRPARPGGRGRARAPGRRLGFGRRGQVVPLVAVAVALVAALAVGLVGVGARAVAQARAQNAADAAALAAAVAPPTVAARTQAEQLARRNRAELVGWRTVGPIVVVTVVLDGARATAAAEPVSDVRVSDVRVSDVPVSDESQQGS